MRRCAEKGCPTILSRYNADDSCFIHQLPSWGPNAWLYLRKRRQEELDGLHPETLKWEDKTPLPAALRDDLPIWPKLKSTFDEREPRDVMEA